MTFDKIKKLVLKITIVDIWYSSFYSLS